MIGGYRKRETEEIREIEKSENMGKNINLAVNAFDEHKAKLDSLNKNKLNKKKDEVISETI